MSGEVAQYAKAKQRTFLTSEARLPTAVTVGAHVMRSHAVVGTMIPGAAQPIVM